MVPLNEMTFAVHEVHKFEAHYKTLKDATMKECDKDTIGRMAHALWVCAFSYVLSLFRQR
jgi:ribosomal protein L37AE/L43A